jgi:hypothetical protein
MSATDEVAGIFDAIDTDTSAHEPIEQEEVSTEAVAEGSEQQGTEQAETEETSASTEGQSSTEETAEHSQTETTEQDFSNWKDSLPPAPIPYAGKKPEFDETGVIVNMTPQEYSDYNTQMALQALRDENFNQFVINKSLDVAEQVLPELKTNQAVRTLVENAQLSSVLNGAPIDAVQAALQVKEALGLSADKIQAAKTEGANSTKASITVQENAALETGSSHVKTTDAQDRSRSIEQRVRRGDSNAFAELLDLWEEEGILKN